jgi:hypothetical protein
MKNLFIILLQFLFITAFQIPAWSQVSYELNLDKQRKMAPLTFLEGKWKGSGWMMGQDRVRQNFEQEEIIELKLSGTMLQIEGIGTAEGKAVHHALALIQPVEEDGQYEFTSFLQSGMRGTYPAQLEGGKLIWKPTDQVRYIIQLNEKGQWNEIGEYNAGNAWYKFFEMTLDKVQ